MLAEYEWEHTYLEASRQLSEILDAEHRLFQQVWYNRHCNLRSKVENSAVLDTVWAVAARAAKETEDQVGAEHLGPWDDFEWGMINGKLSALRWVLGDEWDMLDT